MGLVKQPDNIQISGFIQKFGTSVQVLTHDVYYSWADTDTKVLEYIQIERILVQKEIMLTLTDFLIFVLVMPFIHILSFSFVLNFVFMPCTSSQNHINTLAKSTWI